MYTKEQLMPKRYPENKPSQNGEYIAHNRLDDSWKICVWIDAVEWTAYIDYFIDIPGIPDAFKPVLWWHRIPTNNDWYIVHHKEDNDWHIWQFHKDNVYRWDVIDYFIPIRLDVPDKEDDVSEETIADLRKDIDWLENKFREHMAWHNIKRKPEIAPCPNCDTTVRYAQNERNGYNQLECIGCGYRSPSACLLKEAIRLHNGLGRV